MNQEEESEVADPVSVAVRHIRGRWIQLIAAVFLSLSLVPYMNIALVLAFLRWIMPRKQIFLDLDNRLYEAYLRLCLLVFEYIPANRVITFIYF